MTSVNFNNYESCWVHKFKEMFQALNEPDLFVFPDSSICLLCDSKMKGPIIIKNELSAAIKYIPIKIIGEWTGLSKWQIEKILDAKRTQDYAIERVACKELFDKASSVTEEALSSVEVTTQILTDITDSPPPTRIFYEPYEISKALHYPNITPPPGFSDFKIKKKNIWSTGLADEISLWPSIDHEMYATRNIEQGGNITKEEFSFKSCREVENICRLKDPYLLAVNTALFGNQYVDLPKEGSDEYYEAAEKYALYGVSLCNVGSATGTLIEPISARVDISLSHDNSAEQNQTKNYNRPFTGPISNIDISDPKIKNHPAISTAPQSVNNPKNVIPFPLLYTSPVNQIQPGLIAANQKTKQGAIPKYSPKATANFLTPQQQILLQAAMQKNRQPQGYAYNNTLFPQTVAFPQPLIYANPLLTHPYLSACFKETHVNTSIIQQQQYNFFGAGAYEMLVYAHMLQQTQTVVSKNKPAARNTIDLSRPTSPTFFQANQGNLANFLSRNPNNQRPTLQRSLSADMSPSTKIEESLLSANKNSEMGSQNYFLQNKEE